MADAWLPQAPDPRLGRVGRPHNPRSSTLRDGKAASATSDTLTELAPGAKRDDRPFFQVHGLSRWEAAWQGWPLRHSEKVGAQDAAIPRSSLFRYCVHEAPCCAATTKKRPPPVPVVTHTTYVLPWVSVATCSP